MGKRITVHNLDDADDANVLAIIHPDGTITGTDDPVLVRTSRDALADPSGDHDPRFRGFVPGPATRYDGQSLEWAACIQGALLDRGLRGRAIGYRWRRPAPDHRRRDVLGGSLHDDYRDVARRTSPTLDAVSAHYASNRPASRSSPGTGIFRARSAVIGPSVASVAAH